MSLLQLKDRPIRRDIVKLYDDRLFIIACDDTYAPKQYFDFFKIPRIHFFVIPTTDGTSAAKHVLERLLQFNDLEEYDERWLVLDVDHCAKGSHLASFQSALEEAIKNKINIALSKPCFELWLALHHAEESQVASLADATETERFLRATIGEYNKKNLKEHFFPISLVIEACQRAERLNTPILKDLIPQQNTSRVYQLWKAITSKAHPSQIPTELRNLIPQGSADTSA